MQQHSVFWLNIAYIAIHSDERCGPWAFGLIYFSEATINVILTRGTDSWWRKAKLLLAIYKEPRNILLFILYVFFKYMQAFNSALLFLLFHYYFYLLDPNLDLRFLKNALLSVPFGQSFPFFLAYFARSVLMKKQLSRAASPQSFELFWLQCQYLKIKMPYFGFSFS